MLYKITIITNYLLMVVGKGGVSLYRKLGDVIIPGRGHGFPLLPLLVCNPPSGRRKALQKPSRHPS